MKSANHKLLCAWMLVLGLLLGACGGNRSGSATNAPNNAPNNGPARTSANRGAAARENCAAMTNEVSAITGLKLRQPPLELHAPDEGLLRGCTWSEEGGGLNTFGITKEPASKYVEHDEDKYRKAFPERFKQLEGFGDKAFASPMALEGWTACALRGSEAFCVEITGEATTEDQAKKLLRMALDRF